MFTGLESGVTYDFTITSKTGDQVGNTASIYNIIVAPDQVTNLNDETLFYNSAYLTWGQASGATRYEIISSPVTTTQSSNSLNSHLFVGLSPDSLYDFTVTSYNEDQIGDTVTITNVLTAPDSVTNFSNALATYKDVYLTWDVSQGAIGYEIVSDPATNTQSVEAVNSHTFNGLSDNTVYNFTITSKNGIKIGNTMTINGITTAPENVTGFSNALASYNSVNLSWGVSPGATRYEIVSDPVTITQDSDTSSSHEFAGLSSHTLYNFSITSYNGDQFGNTISVSSILTAPEHVLNLSNHAPSSSNVILNWGSTPGADEYYIIADTSPESTESTSETSYNFSGLSSSTSYSFEVVSYNGDQEGNSISISSTTAVNAPQSMARSGSSVSVGTITHSSINLTWTNSLGATYYEITEPNVSTSTVFTEIATISGLDSNKLYNFTITPYNSDDIGGGNINSGNITTAPASVAYLRSSSVSNDSIILDWDSSSGATKYVIQPNNGLSSFEVNDPATNTTITGLNPNTLYTFSITSHNGSNEGGVFSVAGSPSYSYSGIISGFNNTTIRNGYIYNTSEELYGDKVFSQLSDKPYIMEQGGNTTSTDDTDYTLGSLVDMVIPYEITSEVIASYQEGFYIDFEVDNSSITHINPLKFRYKQTAHANRTPFNILLIGKEFPSSDWTYIKEKTNISASTDWFDSDTFNTAGKFSIFRMYMDASESGSTDNGVSLSDFDIIGDGYLRSQDSGTGILTAPVAVTGISYSNVTEENATITWNAATGANAYSITNGLTTKYTNETNTIIYDDLSGNTLYSFTVTSMNYNLSGGSGSIANILTAPDAINAATVTIVDTTDTTIELSWEGVAGATKYVVSNGSDTQNTNSETIIFNSLISDTLYDFAFTSYNGDIIDGGQSSITDITTGPAAVTGVNATTTSDSTIVVDWNSSPTATKYVVVNQDGSETQNTTGNSVTFTGLQPLSFHRFTVISYKGDTIRGGSLQSSESRVGPVAPTGLSASFTQWNANKIDLSWTIANGADSHLITTNPETTPVYLANTDTTYQFTGLNANTLYEFTITSMNGANRTGGAATVSETTGPRAIAFSNTLSTYNTITTNWNTVPGSDSYLVSSRPGLNGAWNDVTISDTSTTTYTFTGLPDANRDYHVRFLPMRGGKQGNGIWLYPVNTAPGRVYNLSTSTITTSSINLTWAEPLNSTGVIYYVTAPGVTTRTTSGSSVTMSGLSSSQSYTFTVTSMNGNHEGLNRSITASTTGGWASVSGYTGITTTNGYKGSTRMFNEVTGSDIIKLGSQSISNANDIVSTATGDKTWSNPDHGTSTYEGLKYGFGFYLYVRTGWSTLTHFLPTQFRFQNHGERNETPSHVKVWGRQDSSDTWSELVDEGIAQDSSRLNIKSFTISTTKKCSQFRVFFGASHKTTYPVTQFSNWWMLGTGYTYQ